MERDESMVMPRYCFVFAVNLGRVVERLCCLIWWFGVFLSFASLFV